MKSFEKNYFKPNELENLYEELTIRATLNDLPNAYECFIAEKKATPYPKETLTEKHHIIPKHANGSDDISNLILLSQKDHIIAHWLLWKVKGSEKDYKAYVFRVSTSEERAQIRDQNVQTNVQKYKEQKEFFYDPKCQSEQGKKGGLKGGAANTQAQFEARQKVGKEWGPITGSNNKGDRKKEFAKNRSVWEFVGFQNVGGDFQGKSQRKRPSETAIPVQFYVLVDPKKDYDMVLDVLALFAPGSIPPVSIPKKKNELASMYKLIDVPKRIYGWKFYKELTCSEFDEGVLDQLAIQYFSEKDLPE